MATSSTHGLGTFRVLALGVLGTILPIGPQAVARAHGADDGGDPAGNYIQRDEISSQMDGIGITERLGAALPLTTPFRDQDGRPVVLGDYFQDQLPVVLTFNYSSCPQMCSMQLNALATALETLDFTPGREFKIVTIDLESRESPSKVHEMRDKYLERLPAERRAAAARGWTYLVARTPSDDSGIKAVADAAGFHYRHIPERNEYAHPAALIFVSSRGTVTRYVGGTDYPTDLLHASIVSAGTAETSTTAGFIMTCFHFESNGHAHVAVVAIRVGAVAFLVLFFSALGLWRYLARSRSQHGVARS
jgi:protein SCO1/2